MMFTTAHLVSSLFLLLPSNGEEWRQEVHVVLAAQQRAAVAADADTYFGHFSPDAIVMGTAPEERFTSGAYRDWVAPMFSYGPRPVATVIEEAITVAEDGTLAWFDQRVRRPGLGELRLSGVLRKAANRWQIVQLNRTFLVPNELLSTLVERGGKVQSAEADQPQRKASGSAVPGAEDIQAAKLVLRNFHRAAAEANFSDYCKQLADDAVVLGIAAGERCTKSDLRSRLNPLLERSRQWGLTPVEQHVYLAASRRYAWFDERLASARFGEFRGTGVLRRDNGAWKIVHYNSAVVMPNQVVSVFLQLRDPTPSSATIARRLLSDDTGAMAPGPGTVDLSPNAWPEREFVEFIERSRGWGQRQPAAVSKRGMVVATTQALAVRAGVEALRQGGTAADAACATALTQISLNAGATVSYAGIMSLVYYEAERDEVQTLMAPFGVPLGEESPLTIPPPDTPSGRNALVPGFMKGIEAAHQRFGRLPFSCLFGPAVFFAERGIVVEGPIEAWIGEKAAVLKRRPATRDVFTNDDGELIAHGEYLRQRALAETLRGVAAQGADYMYKGDWAEAFANAVQAEGGKISTEDLARYEILWSKPLRTTYRERDVCTVAAPMIGGRRLVESLNLLELAELSRFGHYAESAESLYWLIQCARMPILLDSLPWLRLKLLMPAVSLDPAKRTSKENARRMWEQMQQPNFMRRLQGVPPMQNGATSGHSDGIVVVDAAGNVAAMCHTINTDTWGRTGLCVRGVSIPDAASRQQGRVAAAGPGGYLPNEMSPAIVLAAGKPILASSAIGRSLHEATVSCLLNCLEFGMTPDDALRMPMLLTAYNVADAFGRSQFYKQGVQKGRYPTRVLEELQARGQDVVQLESFQVSRFRGSWIGIAIDPKTAERRGAADSNLNGAALGQD